ncbi:MAG: hypothetical protein WCA77_00690 [Thermoplasmata archaeon]
MTDPLPPLPVLYCPQCQGTFLPRPGSCPRCGATSLEPREIPPSGIVLAATELTLAPAGWSSPHRLVLVECAESVRLLAATSAALPTIGDTVTVERHDLVYRIHPP